MTLSQSCSQVGSAADLIVHSRNVRLWAIQHASEQLLRVWQESQRPDVSRELAPSLLLGQLDWTSTLHQLLYDWDDHDIEYYHRAYSQQHPTDLCSPTQASPDSVRLP